MFFFWGVLFCTSLAVYSRSDLATVCLKYFLHPRHTADLLTSAEGTLSTERVQELQARVDELSAALSLERKENVLNQEKEKANTSELRVEIGKLKARLEDTIRAHKAAL
jgi:hypothetical protein